MTFPLPLAVGIEGADEVMELEIADASGAEDLLGRMKSHAPRGLTPLVAEILPPDAKKAPRQERLLSGADSAPARLPSGRANRRLLAQFEALIITRAGGRSPVDLRRHAGELSFGRACSICAEGQAGRCAGPATAGRVWDWRISNRAACILHGTAVQLES